MLQTLWSKYLSHDPMLHPTTLQPLIHQEKCVCMHVSDRNWKSKIWTHLSVALTLCLTLYLKCVFRCGVLNLLLWLGLQAKYLSLSLFFPLSLALSLAAAATPLCAFVTVATNSKARQRCSIAVDVKARRAGRPLTHTVLASTSVSRYTLMHTHTDAYTYAWTQIHIHSYECAWTHTWTHILGGGGPLSLSKEGDGAAESILSQQIHGLAR